MKNAVPEGEWKPKHGPWIVAIPTITAAFMFVLDSTIANVALPHMAGSFSASREESIWILTCYLIASGIIIPAVDWFTKFLGRKKFFIMSVILFASASFLCGISNSLEMMIAARILQGFGGGGIIPVSQAVLLESFSVEERGKAMSAFGLVVVVAPIIGPVLGGWITDNWSWPWIFFINIPIGILTVFLTNAFLEDPPYARKQKNLKFDILGFTFLACWLISLQVILDKGNNADWFNAPWVCRLTLLCILSALLFIVSQTARKDSLVDLSIFKNKNYTLGTMVQVVIMGVLLASLAILPQFLQSMMGYDAFLSGLSMMPRGFGSIVALLLCGTISNKIDNRILITAGLSLIAAAGWTLGFLSLEITTFNIAVPNFLLGMGMGLAMIPIISLSVMTIDNSQMTNASGLQNLLKNIGGAVGTSLAATMITRFSQIHQYMLVHNLTPLNPVFSEKLAVTKAALTQYMHHSTAEYAANYSLYGELLQQSALWGFIETFRVFGIASAIVIPLVFLLKKPKAENIPK